MKRFLKSSLILILTLVIAVSSLIVVAAEVKAPIDDDPEITSITVGVELQRAYELVWKYKYGNGHCWKRRWNATLGMWYDPEWILVW